MTTETTTKPAETALAKPVKLEEQIQVWETEKGEVKLSVALVRMYFCPEATTVEAMTFLSICKYQKLNPWLREAYLIKYGTQPASIVVGKETFSKRAERHPAYRGYRAGVVVSPADKPADFSQREGSLVLKGETLIGGWCEVFRDGRNHPTVAVVSLTEYEGRTREGELNKTWRGKSATMIRKVAFVQAHREAFPEEFEGLYDEAEIRDDTHRPEGFGMPLSVAEAAAKDGGNGKGSEIKQLEVTTSPAEPAGTPGTSEIVNGANDAACDFPSPEEQEAIRAQEQAEAEAQAAPPPPPVKVDRTKVFLAVKDRARKANTTVVAVLKDLTAKSSMPDLNDAEVVALAKKLGV